MSSQGGLSVGGRFHGLAPAYRKRAKSRLTCEALEERQLLSVAMPDYPAAEVRALARAGPLVKAPSLFIEPQAGRAPIIQAINAARSEIRLGICNISDPRELCVDVASGRRRVACVGSMWKSASSIKPTIRPSPDEQAELATLGSGRASRFTWSNAVFPQSFEKDLVIDQREVLIMTMCLIPQTFEDTRDYGLVVANPGIIRGVTSVFDTDWAYSAPPGDATPAYNPTPALRAPNLIWGPTDATAKLSQLIQSAHRSIDVTTELLSDPYLEGQLGSRQAASRGASPPDHAAGYTRGGDQRRSGCILDERRRQRPRDRRSVSCREYASLYACQD